MKRSVAGSYDSKSPEWQLIRKANRRIKSYQKEGLFTGYELISYKKEYKSYTNAEINYLRAKRILNDVATFSTPKQFLRNALRNDTRAKKSMTTKDLAKLYKTNMHNITGIFNKFRELSEDVYESALIQNRLAQLGHMFQSGEMSYTELLNEVQSLSNELSRDVSNLISDSDRKLIDSMKSDKVEEDL